MSLNTVCGWLTHRVRGPVIRFVKFCSLYFFSAILSESNHLSRSYRFANSGNHLQNSRTIIITDIGTLISDHKSINITVTYTLLYYNNFKFQLDVPLERTWNTKERVGTVLWIPFKRTKEINPRVMCVRPEPLHRLVLLAVLVSLANSGISPTVTGALNTQHFVQHFLFEICF